MPVKKNVPVLLFAAVLLYAGCKKPDPGTPQPPASGNTLQETVGFSILDRLKGIWNGPVVSGTPLGSYPEWIVDFRPVTANQISAKNELDSLNDIHMSFFVAKYKNSYRVAFRNGGSFAGLTRVSYFLADSVSETPSQAYYRFSEVIKGRNRAYTEAVFRGDSLILKSYTNHYNTLSAPALHMKWSAARQDLSSAQPAVSHFGFPQKTLGRDLSDAFGTQAEAIYYSISGGDPYPETEQPYLGQTQLQYSYAPGYTPDAARNVFIVITTQPLINGFSMNLDNLRYRSRYVTLASTDMDFIFSSMHPGSYYVYALYDADGNRGFSSGDWVSASNTSFVLAPESQTQASVQLNFTIP